MTELAMQSLVEVSKLLHAGHLSPIELTQALLERIEREDSRFNSYVTVLPDVALAQAKMAEEEIRAGKIRGPLHGIPIAVKDLCFTKDIPTGCGSEMFADWCPEVDATVVTKLAQAGSILLGKLHMTEFALRWHHPYRPIPTNPWGEDLWPGVSSSGSGVATAAGLCYGALGSDTGGSIRFPAASCGIVGLKPTYGRVSRYGAFPLGESLDHIGPLTRRTADAAAMFGVIAGYDPLDATSSVHPVPDGLAALEKGVAKLRIGVDETYITEGVHPEVSASIHQAIKLFVEMGAQVVEVKVPDVSAVLDAWYPMTAAEAAAAHEELFPARADEYGPFRQLLEEGAQLRAQDYAKAHFVREEFASRLAVIFKEIDLLVCPTVSTPTPRMDAEGNAVMESTGGNDTYVRTRFTYPFNFSRNPTLSLPCGISSDSRPISLQLVGRHFGETALFQAGHAFEQATQWHNQWGKLLMDAI